MRRWALFSGAALCAAACSNGGVAAPGSEGRTSAGAADLFDDDSPAVPPGPAAGEADCPPDGDAYQAHLMMQRAIAARARNPKSTEFDLASVATHRLGAPPCRWMISAEGRSENAFGGLSIVSYRATASFSAGAWSVDEISVEER